jgi:hypothetical protein
VNEKESGNENASVDASAYWGELVLLCFLGDCEAQIFVLDIQCDDDEEKLKCE